MKPADSATGSTAWLTYQQAAAVLHCSTKTIQRLVRRGELTKHVRAGSNTRYVSATQVNALAEPVPAGAAQ
ncbi:MerR-like helix-turn-helix DNA binding domain protein [Arthrobacter phage Shambre1]|uniref:MerR-like helix-turn-helix DNA binding domain protein n=1 Tax=Arthrobacter phage Shambre1 TaxID=2927284 RepID=A0A977KNM5_9CAUD|nr:MerR-like helix-turn-helix DNA binding domain protein [Arthrobacter phage Shambre1]UXE04787.1 MerR-like helix-turn-helix DNA binding domain protein [Arthrobacter phage Shambre1]